MLSKNAQLPRQKKAKSPRRDRRVYRLCCFGVLLHWTDFPFIATAVGFSKVSRAPLISTLISLKTAQQQCALTSAATLRQTSAAVNEKSYS
jgi:hypothetical protein